MSKFFKISILVKIFQNLNSGLNSRKISIFVKTFKILDFGKKKKKIVRYQYWSKFSNKKPILFPIFEKYQYWSNFIKKKSQFGWKFSKILTLVKKNWNLSILTKNLLKNLDLSKNFRIASIFEKSRFGSKFSKNLDFVHYLRKISILLQNFENLDFGEYLQSMSILLKIFKNLDFDQHYLNYRFWSKFSKISFSVKIFDKSQLRLNFFRKIPILVKIL